MDTPEAVLSSDAQSSLAVGWIMGVLRDAQVNVLPVCNRQKPGAATAAISVIFRRLQTGGTFTSTSSPPPCPNQDRAGAPAICGTRPDKAVRDNRPAGRAGTRGMLPRPRQTSVRGRI